jgi:hypothetical protein
MKSSLANGPIPGWWTRFELRRAAKRYADKLPSHLSQSYGKSRTYTSGQLTTAVQHLGLSPRHIALAFAAYQDQADYDLGRVGQTIWPEHAWTRELFIAALPWRGKDPGPYYTGPDSSIY